MIRLVVYRKVDSLFERPIVVEEVALLQSEKHLISDYFDKYEPSIYDIMVSYDSGNSPLLDLGEDSAIALVALGPLFSNYSFREEGNLSVINSGSLSQYWGNA